LLVADRGRKAKRVIPVQTAKMELLVLPEKTAHLEKMGETVQPD
jgi:hypothetical protein